MADLVQQIVGDFERLKWKSDPYARFEELVFGAPERVGEFLREALHRWPEGGVFFSDAISFAPDEELGRLIPVALDLMESGRSVEASESLIARCSEQVPGLLHPHLERIFRLKPNEPTYYAGWPWRESGDRQVEFLGRRLTERGAADREFALDALAEIRTEAALHRVLRERINEPVSPAAYCRVVGFEPHEAAFRSLYTTQPWHLVFEPGHFPSIESGPPHLRQHHPTWRSISCRRPAHRFGGEGTSRCGGCGGTNHHLLTFDSSAVQTAVSSRRRLSLEVCLSCLGWEEPQLFYRHDAAGNVTGEANPRAECQPQFPTVALKEGLVALEPAADRWRWQDWAMSNGRQNLHRLGGHPCWVQDADYPTCPGCGTTMRFLLQLDSNLPKADGDEWLWGSGGIGYVCWCDACAISAYGWQCT